MVEAHGKGACSHDAMDPRKGRCWPCLEAFATHYALGLQVWSDRIAQGRFRMSQIHEKGACLDT